jgi:hypothetical protein
MFCRSLFVLLYFFLWPLCCLSFFDLRLLVSSNSSHRPYSVKCCSSHIKNISLSRIKRYPYYFRHTVTLSAQAHWTEYWSYCSITHIFGLGYITSLSPPHVTKVPVPSQKSKWSCIYVLGISILPISTIFLLDCGNAPTLWYFFYFHFIRNIIKFNSIKGYFNQVSMWGVVYMCMRGIDF